MHHSFINSRVIMLTFFDGASEELSNLGKGNIMYRQLTSKTDCWSAWFLRPALEQTCSCQCEKGKKKKVKKTIAPVSLNGCQPSVSDTWARTKQLSPCWREETHRYGGRGRSKASVTEHKDILIRLNAAAWGFIKMPQQPPPPTHTPSSRRKMDVTTLWDLQGGRAAGLALPVSRRHLCVLCIQRPTSKFCSCTEILIFFFFSSTTCQQLLSAHCCGVFVLHLLEVTCQSHGTGGSVTPSANEVLSFCELCTRRLSLLCLFQTNKGVTLC